MVYVTKREYLIKNIDVPMFKSFAVGSLASSYILSGYIGVIINFDLLKRFDKNPLFKKFDVCYYDCVYTYSHRKFSTLLKDEVLKYLFENFFASGKLDEMIDTDKTMSKNKEQYVGSLELFKISFASGKYISKLPKSK